MNVVQIGPIPHPNHDFIVGIMKKLFGKSVSGPEVKKEMSANLLKSIKRMKEGRDKLKEDFEKVLADAVADGVVWSEVEFVSVDTSEIEPARLPFGTKSSTLKEGDIEVTLSHKGKN